MLDLAAKFETDPSKEEEGTWIILGSDAAIKVARWGNANFRNCTAALLKQYDIIGGPTAEQREDVVVQAMAQFILVDWRNIAVRGQDLPYSHENALTVLRDRELREFANVVTMHSNEIENFRKDKVADDAGK